MATHLGEASNIPCYKCGGPVVEFSVPNTVWNMIVRNGGSETDQEYLCLDCFARKASGEIERLQGSEEAAWGLIANAYGGDWDQASEASGWKQAAERWRDEYHRHLPQSITRTEEPI